MELPRIRNLNDVISKSIEEYIQAKIANQNGTIGLKEIGKNGKSLFSDATVSYNKTRKRKKIGGILTHYAASSWPVCRDSKEAENDENVTPGI